ncbi:MAG: hypothetical protein U0871_09895 [Gemmataceae bacterium]
MAVLLLFSLNTRVQIGVRLVFPLVMFLLVALAAASQKGLLTRLLAWAAVGWTAWVSVGVWPDGVRHVNRLRGDPADGWRWSATPTSTGARGYRNCGTGGRTTAGRTCTSGTTASTRRS